MISPTDINDKQTNSFQRTRECSAGEKENPTANTNSLNKDITDCHNNSMNLSPTFISYLKKQTCS